MYHRNLSSHLLTQMEKIRAGVEVAMKAVVAN
jgi:hypothetical protein